MSFFRYLCLAACLLAMLLGALPGRAQGFSTQVLPSDLDTPATAEWVDGKEIPIARFQEPDGTLTALIWTQRSAPGNTAITYGATQSPGARHLRIGFTRAIPVGTVLARGTGTLSVLKPTATYPGRLEVEADWLSAERAQRGELSVWVLPPGTQTRAFRFTHVSPEIAAQRGGSFSGAYILADRFADLAPQATPIASANQPRAALLTNGKVESWWDAWDNGATGARQPVSAEHAEWVLLNWPSPVQLRGLCALWTGFAMAEVQVYTGPATRHPREATDADWRTVKTYPVDLQYPRALAPNWLDFGTTLTTRAVRVRIIKAAAEQGSVVGKTFAGKRVWLGEVLALHPLGAAPLASVTPAQETNLHPPIPVRFTLKEAGYVTLAIDDAQGKRVRNLVSETYFPAGNNVVWWDGLDETDINHWYHGIYEIQGRQVAPGTYRVRGLYRKAIDVRYEFSVYTGGNPAWRTAEGTGRWLADHTPPSDVLFLPGEAPQVLIVSHVAEAGDGLAWVDLSGQKQRSLRWIGGTWTGATHLARDAGDRAVPDVYAYSGSSWTVDNDAQKRGEVRLMALGANDNKSVVAYRVASQAEAKLGGLAVHNGLLVAALPALKQLLFVDAAAGKVLGAAPMDAPGGLAFERTGALLALSGSQLLRIPLPATLGAPLTLTPQPLITQGLEDPQRLTLDVEGNIYISDWGASHQVKVFTAAGRPLRTIGQPGGARLGTYDPARMDKPNGLTITSDGHLWVAESSDAPKRVSVWTLDGQFVRAMYGPPQYGGGGAIDPRDRTRFYYARSKADIGLELRLDWDKGTFTVANIYYLPGAQDLQLPGKTAPQTPIYVQGRQYMTNAYNTSPTNGAPVAGLWLMRDGIAVPVAAVGQAMSWELLQGDAFKSRLPAGVTKFKNDLFFAWSDLDDDAQLQPDEVTFTISPSGTVSVAGDLSMVTSGTLRCAPLGFTKGGAPIYDATHAQLLAEKVAGGGGSGGSQVLYTGGWAIVTGGPMRGFRDGKLVWTYPSQWPSLHGSHRAPLPQYPGQMLGTTRLLGLPVTPRASDAGAIWGINGNKGNLYLMTADGLFVATLFRDSRQSSWSGLAVTGKRGMRINEVSLHEEDFWPALSQTADGTIYATVGIDHSSIARIDGLESIRRLPTSEITVTTAQLAAAQQYFIQRDAQRLQQVGRDQLSVPIAKTAPTVDGKLDEDWATAEWVTIDDKATAALRIAGDRLYAAYRTGDARLLANTGEAWQLLFKSGGALDLMLTSNAGQGDLRLLITQVNGKTMAVRYRPTAPGEAHPVSFSSPWRTITIDQVLDVSAQVQLAAGKTGEYELSVPLSVLGVTPKDGLQLRGDIGLLRGDGFQTLQRAYWNNKSTGLTSDIPGEALLTQQLWGRWVLVNGE